MQYLFDPNEISGIKDVDAFIDTVKGYCKTLERARKEAELSKEESEKYLQGMLVTLIVKLHERLNYIEQFAPVKVKGQASELLQ